MPTTPIDLLPYLSSDALANVSGGNSIGLIDVNGVNEIPSFVGIDGVATITVTPVKDGCVGLPITFNYEIENCNPLLLSFITQDSVPISAQTGYINSFVSGGTAPYTYFWSNSEGTQPDIYRKSTFGTTTITRTLIVTDALGQTITGTATINGITSPFIFSTKSGSIAGGNASYNVTTTPNTGIYAPVQYTFSNGVVINQSGSGISIPTTVAGFLIVQSIDNQGSWTTVSTPTHYLNSLPLGTPVGTPPTNMESFVQTIVRPSGENFTSVNAGRVFPSGTPFSTTSTYTYTYLWSNGNTTNSLTNVPAGNYSCTITALISGVPNGEVQTVNITIAPSILKSINIVITNSSGGLANGTVEATINNGTAPFRFIVTNNSGTNGVLFNPTSLLSGSYIVTVHDFLGETFTQSITIL